MHRRFPTTDAWRRHTQGATQRGLSAGALACLGTMPRVECDASSFTGFMGRVTCLNRDEAVAAGVLASQAVGRGRGVRATRLPNGLWAVAAPVSVKAARELQHPKRVPAEPSVAGVRTRAYDLVMRPTARARIWAEAILSED